MPTSVFDRLSNNSTATQRRKDKIKERERRARENAETTALGWREGKPAPQVAKGNAVPKAVQKKKRSNGEAAPAPNANAELGPTRSATSATVVDDQAPITDEPLEASGTRHVSTTAQLPLPPAPEPPKAPAVSSVAPKSPGLGGNAPVYNMSSSSSASSTSNINAYRPDEPRRPHPFLSKAAERVRYSSESGRDSDSGETAPGVPSPRSHRRVRTTSGGSNAIDSPLTGRRGKACTETASPLPARQPGQGSALLAREHPFLSPATKRKYSGKPDTGRQCDAGALSTSKAPVSGPAPLAAPHESQPITSFSSKAASTPGQRDVGLHEIPAAPHPIRTASTTRSIGLGEANNDEIVQTLTRELALHKAAADAARREAEKVAIEAETLFETFERKASDRISAAERKEAELRARADAEAAAAQRAKVEAEAARTEAAELRAKLAAEAAARDAVIRDEIMAEAVAAATTAAQAEAAKARREADELRAMLAAVEMARDADRAAAAAEKAAMNAAAEAQLMKAAGVERAAADAEDAFAAETASALASEALASGEAAVLRDQLALEKVKRSHAAAAAAEDIAANATLDEQTQARFAQLAKASADALAEAEAADSNFAAEVAQAAAEATSLRWELERSEKATVTALSAKDKDIATKVAEAEALRAELEASVNAMEAAKLNAAAEAAQLRADLERYRNGSSTAASAAAASSAQVVRMEAENSNLKRRLTDAASESSRALATEKKRAAEASTLRTQVAELEAQRHAAIEQSRKDAAAAADLRVRLEEAMAEQRAQSAVRANGLSSQLATKPTTAEVDADAIEKSVAARVAAARSTAEEKFCRTSATTPAGERRLTLGDGTGAQLETLHSLTTSMETLVSESEPGFKVAAAAAAVRTSAGAMPKPLTTDEPADSDTEDLGPPPPPPPGAPPSDDEDHNPAITANADDDAAADAAVLAAARASEVRRTAAAAKLAEANVERIRKNAEIAEAAASERIKSRTGASAADEISRLKAQTAADRANARMASANENAELSSRAQSILARARAKRDGRAESASVTPDQTSPTGRVAQLVETAHERKSSIEDAKALAIARAKARRASSSGKANA